MEYLAAADQRLWQFCPLGPTAGGSGNSPYQTYSAFAGDPLLVDLDTLREWGWLPGGALDDTDVQFRLAELTERHGRT